MKHFYATLVLTCTLTTAPAANANPWEAQMDLLAAGAAASVVLHHACTGITSDAVQKAAQRLRDVALTMADPEGAYLYATKSFELKIKALWQSSSGACLNMQRLQEIASSTGFILPR